MRLLLPLALALPTLAQDTGRAHAEARAEARADAKADARADASQRRSHTRRVVVVNGKTVVDEETVDGKPVRPGRRPAPAIPRQPRLPELPELPDPERLLEELERDLPADARDLLRRARQDGKATRSHTRRVVVINGETVVDEETVDGKPVTPARRAPERRDPVVRPGALKGKPLREAPPRSPEPQRRRR